MMFLNKVVSLLSFTLLLTQFGDSEAKDTRGRRGASSLSINVQDDVVKRNKNLATTCDCDRGGHGFCRKNPKPGDDECVCNFGYGAHESGTFIKSVICKECKCGRVDQSNKKGRNFSCTFITGIFSDSKKCTCDASGYYDRSGECKACDCGERYDGIAFNCNSSGTCTCGRGYTPDKKKCKAANVCILKPCLNGGTCKDAKNADGFKCDCQTGFDGRLCENKTKASNACILKPCLNGGTCENANNADGFKCECQTRFEGRLCENKIQVLACRCDQEGNGFCRKNPQHGQDECQCNTGYGACEIGTFIKSLICKECKCGSDEKGTEFNCTFNGGLFSDGKKCICDASGYFERSEECKVCGCGRRYDGVLFNCTASRNCVCSVGYKQVGDKCIVSNACRLNPCLNGGNCVNVAEGDGFKCECRKTYKGKLCEERDACTSDSCLNYGICIRTTDDLGFQCQCQEGFYGRNCELIDTNPCDEKPCANGGTCTKINATTFECNCPAIYTGPICETTVNACGLYPCLNDGKCVNVGEDGGFICECSKGYQGKLCEERVVCTSDSCLNNGICIKTSEEQGFRCVCQKGFHGRQCEQLD